MFRLLWYLGSAPSLFGNVSQKKTHIASFVCPAFLCIFLLSCNICFGAATCLWLRFSLTSPLPRPNTPQPKPSIGSRTHSNCAGCCLLFYMDSQTVSNESKWVAPVYVGSVCTRLCLRVGWNGIKSNQSGDPTRPDLTQQPGASKTRFRFPLR